MVTLNLFPWREELRIYQRKRFIHISLGSLFVNGLILFSIHFLLLQNAVRIKKNIEQLNNQWMGHVAKLHFRDEKSNNSIEKNIIKAYLQYAAETFYFFQGLSVKNSDVCFTQIKRHKNNMTFIGRAVNVATLTHFLQNFPAVQVINKIKIENMKQENDIKFHFYAFAKSNLTNRNVQ